MSPQMSIALWGAFFLLGHFVPSHAPIRKRLVARLGEWPFRGLYSVVATVSFGGLAYAWWTHRHEGSMLFFMRQPAVVHAIELTTVLGVGLLFAGALVPTPTSMTFRGEMDVEPRGALAVTRHPVNMGIAILAAGHMVVNGWVTDLLFWGTLLALGILGPMHEDHRKSLTNDQYRKLRHVTTLFLWPTPSRLRKVGPKTWAGFGLGVAAAVGFRFVHASLFSG